VAADYNISSLFRVGGSSPRTFFEPGVHKPLTFQVTITCCVQGTRARARGDTTSRAVRALCKPYQRCWWRARSNTLQYQRHSKSSTSSIVQTRHPEYSCNALSKAFKSSASSTVQTCHSRHLCNNTATHCNALQYTIIGIQINNILHRDIQYCHHICRHMLTQTNF